MDENDGFLMEEEYIYTEESYDVGVLHGTENEKRIVWTDAATKHLLHSVKEKMDKVGKTIALKNKTKMWKIIAEEMSIFGQAFSAVQVESKFRSLERQYKKALLNNKSTGRARQLVSFQTELDDILGKKKGVNPTFLLGVEDEELQCSSPTSSPSPAEEKQKKPRGTKLESNLMRLTEMCDEIKTQHDEMIDFLKTKEKKKEEYEKKKEERAQRKEELLKKLIEKMN